tara:strand:- start:1589 stop:2446 length:858 start_codon:yes stop_codon:yes gene_type:complete
VEPQQSLTTGGMSSSTFETDEPREIGTQSRQGFRLTVSGGRVSVAGGTRVQKLVALVAFATVALALAVIMLAGLGSMFGIGGGAPDDSGAPGSDDCHITARSGAVASDHGTCSRMGVDRLKAGGNAVDAAVTVALCLGVVRPFSSGMGGGAFILVSLANGTSEVIDAREEAPAAATEDMYVGKPEASLTGGAAIAVPGELQGLRLAWERHGIAPWADNVLPVAALAEGFVVDAEVADAIAHNAEALRRFEAASRLFLPGDRPPASGTTLANTALAATLRTVAARP